MRLIHLLDYVRTERRGQYLVVNGSLEVLPSQQTIPKGDSELTEVVVKVGDLEEVQDTQSSYHAPLPSRLDQFEHSEQLLTVL